MKAITCTGKSAASQMSYTYKLEKVQILMFPLGNLMFVITEQKGTGFVYILVCICAKLHICDYK